MRKLSLTQVRKDSIKKDTNEKIRCVFRVVRPDELLAIKAGNSIVCNGCWQVFYSGAEITAHAASVTEEQFLAGCGSTHPEQIVVGYTDEWCKTKDAYDEDVIIGYKCSTCGEIK